MNAILNKIKSFFSRIDTAWYGLLLLAGNITSSIYHAQHCQHDNFHMFMIVIGYIGSLIVINSSDKFRRGALRYLKHVVGIYARLLTSLHDRL